MSHLKLQLDLLKKEELLLKDLIASVHKQINAVKVQKMLCSTYSANKNASSSAPVKVEIQDQTVQKLISNLDCASAINKTNINLTLSATNQCITEEEDEEE